MDDPIDVGTAKVARGLMTCILFEDHAGNELPRATAVHSHLSTKDVVTITAHRRTTNDLGVL